jgi:hypothetical protein
VLILTLFFRRRNVSLVFLLLFLLSLFNLLYLFMTILEARILAKVFRQVLVARYLLRDSFHGLLGTFNLLFLQALHLLILKHTSLLIDVKIPLLSVFFLLLSAFSFLPLLLDPRCYLASIRKVSV